MDEKLIEQLLQEDVPEWNYEVSEVLKDKKSTNLNLDNLSVYTEGDDENDSCRMNSISNYGCITTASSTNDIISTHSSIGTPFTSPLTLKKYSLSLKTGSNEENNYRSILPHRTGKIIKHTILTKVANQISSSKAKTNMGFPVCCTRGKYLAIGTSKGVTFLFDLKQVLKFYIGIEDGPSHYGAVSSLSFNFGSTRLLVGFVKAHINMWDISGTEGKLLRSIDVNQGPGYAVSFVRFLTDPTMAVYADTNGSVFQLIFKRGISGRSTDTVCFFSGSRGEILCLEPLFIPKHLKKHELADYSLLAMASFTKIIIVICKPQLKVKYMQSLKGKSETMPHLEWSCNVRLTDSDSVNNKNVFLLFGRDTDIYILKIGSQIKSNIEIALESHSAKLKFDIVFHMSLDFQLLSIKWMNSYFVGIIDFDEKFHAIDLQTKSIIESLDIKSVQIVYNTSLFKSTATGGNVSEAMSVAAERACYHSVMELNGQIKILGHKEMHLMMLRPWIEAVEVTKKNEGSEAAFKLCTELYKGKNLTCRQVLMVPSKEEDRQRAVIKVALSLIETSLADLPDFVDYQSFFKAMLDLCEVIKQIPFYTDTVFNKIVTDSDMEVAFLDNIIRLITQNIINTLHPELVQRLVEYLQITKQFDKLDTCITKLNISCIDLDKIIKLSTKHDMFSSFIHIHNSAFNDFLTPIKHMINFVSDTSLPISDHEIQSETVIKVIVYIHCCFAGKDFFTGNALPYTITEEIKTNIFEYLIPYNKNSDTTSLNVLLAHNTNEFLNMITLAFDEPFFTSDIGVSRKQAILQRLCHYFISDAILPGRNEVIRFFVFLSRELNKSSNVSVYIDQVVLDELIERVCLGVSDASQREDLESHSSTIFLQKQAETAFLNFLKCNSSYRDHWLKNERILTLSRKAQFYRVCEFIYRRKKMLHMVLECFLLDPEYRTESFELIDSVWNDDNVDDSQRSQIFDKCFQLSDSLILANPTLSVIVLLTICKKRIEEIINKLGGFQSSSDSSKQIMFSFLKSFFIIRNEIEETEPDVDTHVSVALTIANSMKSIKVHSPVAELFIDLLCRFDPTILHTYLKNSVDYKSENAVTIVMRYNLPYSLGFLYEKMKRVDMAAQLYISIFDKLWTSFVENPDLRPENCSISSPIGKSFQQCIDTFIRLVRKYKSSSEIEVFWSEMLQSILEKRLSSKRQPHESMIEVIFTYFVKYLSQEVSIPVIMTKILKNPVFTGVNFGKVRDLVISMMNSFNYEKILLESCIALVDNDVSNCLIQLKTVMGNGVTVNDPQCNICMKNLMYMPSEYTNNNILTFRCGHRFHVDCLQLTWSSFDEQFLDIQDLNCSLCSSHREYYNSPSHKLIGGFRNRTQPIKDMSSPSSTPENLRRPIDLSKREAPINSSSKRTQSRRNADSTKAQKTDGPIKLNLAPPNYLLNFCTYE